MSTNDPQYEQFADAPPTSPAGAIIAFFAGLILLAALIAGMIANWKAFIGTSANIVQVLLWVVGILFSLVLIGFAVQRGYIGWVQAQHAKEDLKFKQEERQRAQERHKMEMYLAESRLHADPLGNRPFVFDKKTQTVIEVSSGNYQQSVPAHYAPSIQHHNDVNQLAKLLDYAQSTRVQEIASPVLPIGRPSQDMLLRALEQNHEPWTFSPGVKKDDGSVVIVSLTKVPHLKLVGSTGFGKSCLAGAILDQSTELNSPKRLQLALLDLEHKTSRLYEDLPHVAQVQVGKRLVQMVATDADEVAEYTEYLKKELDRRAGLSQQELRKTPVLLMYVEEMLALSYEPFDTKTLARLFANLTLLAVRGRKYGMFLLAAMQIDYSTEELKVASKMFRFRGAAAVDVSAAKASGFINTDLIKQNFQTAQKGEFVVEYPSFSNIVVAPNYDVEGLLNKKDGVFDEDEEAFSESGSQVVNADSTWPEPPSNITSQRDEQAWQAKVEQMRELREQNWGKIAIIEKVWNAHRGDNKPYRQAEKEYEQIISQLEQEESE